MACRKTSRKAALSFLQKLHCSLRKNRFLLSGVYAGIIVLFLLVLLLVVLLLVVLLLVVLHLVVVLLVVLLLGCSGRGAIVVCYGGGEGRVKTNFGGVDVVPLLGMVRGAIAGCHCSVLWWRGGWWGSGRGAIAGCHCSVLWLGGRVTTNFYGCHCSVLWWGCNGCGAIAGLHRRVQLLCAVVWGGGTTL